MRNAPLDDVPQVVAIVRASGEGKVSLKKAVRDYLGAEGDSLYLCTRGEEILLTARGSPSDAPAELLGNRLCLPGQIVARLGLQKGSMVAMIQRGDAVALKKMEIEEREGDRAEVVDYETPPEVTRVAHTNPMPERLLASLEQKYADLALNYDVRGFLRGRATFEAWKARTLIGAYEPSDDRLGQELIRERLDAQDEDGSWGGEVVLTARKLRELTELGLEPDADGIRRAVEWLLSRSESLSNPGMFFLSDDLVAEQARIIEQRKKGIRERFRELRRSEMKLVAAGDDLIRDPCGPRIMWPNALVLESLLSLGYEENERVQAAIRVLSRAHWCECGYQHGLASWRNAEPPTMAEIEEMEKECVGEYRYGGIAGTADLAKMDLTKTVGAKMPRVSRTTRDGVDEFRLRVPTHIQPCELMTVRAFSRVRDERIRRIAEAHLWRFAGRQQPPGGGHEGWDVHRYFHDGQAALLEIFARYDHPVSKVVILRSIPWVIDAQNEDGSWGREPYRDASTVAVVSALVSLGDELPSGARP